jgi:hypothetical protein
VQVSVKDVGRFLASLTEWEFIRSVVERDPNYHQQSKHQEDQQTEKSIHNRIALALVKEIILNPLSSFQFHLKKSHNHTITQLHTFFDTNVCKFS